MMTATWPMGPRGLSLRTGDVTLPASGLRRPPVIDTRVTNDRNSTLVPPSLIPRGTARERARDTLRTGTGPVGTGILSVVYWVPGSPMGPTTPGRPRGAPPRPGISGARGAGLGRNIPSITSMSTSWPAGRTGPTRTDVPVPVTGPRGEGACRGPAAGDTIKAPGAMGGTVTGLSLPTGWREPE